MAKGQRRFEGFDQATIRLYSRGLTTREIEGHLTRQGRNSALDGPVESRGVCSTTKYDWERAADCSNG